LSYLNFGQVTNHYYLQRLFNTFRQLLGQVQHRTWFIVDDFRDNLGNLVHAIKLNTRDYRTLLITSGILRRRGNELVISNGALQELTERLQPDMSIYITRARILNRNTRNNFVAINEPIYRYNCATTIELEEMDWRLLG